MCVFIPVVSVSSRKKAAAQPSPHRVVIVHATQSSAAMHPPLGPTIGRSLQLADVRAWRRRTNLQTQHDEPRTISQAVTTHEFQLQQQSPSPQPQPLPPRMEKEPPVAAHSGSAADMLDGLGRTAEQLDDLGLDLPAKELKPMDIGPGGVVGALKRRDAAAFKRIARRLGKDWWCALDWGEAPLGGWQRVCDEGARAWPFMQPGRILRDGQVLDGVSPSGAPRGDRYVLTSDARLGGTPGDCRDLAAAAAEEETAEYGAVRGIAARLSALGDSLSEALAAEPRLQLTITNNTEALFACFPGHGSKYNVHYDGGGGDPRKLTAILYVNEGWRAEDDGRLMMYDSGGFSVDGPGLATERCWRCVYPRAGRLVLFRSDLVLHKVNPTHAIRYAVTMFFAAATRKELKAKGKASKERDQGPKSGAGLDELHIVS